MQDQSPKKAWIAVLKGSVLPLAIGLGLTAIFIFLYSKFGEDYKKHIDKALLSFLIVFITYWVFKISASLFDWYAANIASKTKTPLDDKFIPLFKRITVTLVWAIGIILLLSRFGVNISALVATLGVGSLAIALAAQDTIANIIAGFLIMIDGTFSIGDDIKLPSGERVKVIEVGVRRSKFLAEDSGIVIMPNLELSKSKVVNYSYRKGAKNA